MLKPSIETHVVDGVFIAEFWENLRLDPTSVQSLRNHYDAHLKTQRRPDVVIDLSGVDFAGSAALGHFVALQRLVRSKGGRIVFCNVDPTVAEVFRASKLESLFEFAPNRAAALAVISEPQPPHLVDQKLATTEPNRNDKLPSTGRTSSGPLRRRKLDA